MVRRREFIVGLGIAAARPFAAGAQQPALPVIGWRSVWEPQQNPSYVAAFRKGLNEAGFIEGQNVAIEFRWSGEQPDRLPTLAADLVRRQVNVIIADTNAVLAAKAATSSIPIVFASGGDPVEMRLVASLNSPSGNVTGASFLSDDLLPKKLELLHEVVPKSPLIGFLVNPTLSVAARLVANLQPAARNAWAGVPGPERQQRWRHRHSLRRSCRAACGRPSHPGRLYSRQGRRPRPACVSRDTQVRQLSRYAFSAG
jgi:putative tryptophan/tyrosine transport system substrate-binding protein